jgi:NTE family protein
VAGISIGAINAAIIAGSPPDKGVDHLRRFWRQVTQDARAAWPEGFLKGDWSRRFLSRMSAGMAMTSGVPGFFVPRMPFPWLYPTGAIEARSF